MQEERPEIQPNEVYSEQFEDLMFEEEETLASFKAKLVARGANIALNELDDPELTTWFQFSPSKIEVTKVPFLGTQVVTFECSFDEIIKMFQEQTEGEGDIAFLEETVFEVEKMASAFRKAFSKRKKRNP